MKSPWDDEGTAVIKSDEVTEQWQSDELLRERKKRLRDVTEVDVPAEKEPKAPATKQKRPAESKVFKDVESSQLEEAVEDTISKIQEREASELTQLIEASEITSPRTATLGDLLVHTTNLTQEQLDEALAIQKEQNGGQELLGDVLIKKKYITELDLLKALSLQLNIPVAPDLAKEEFDAELVTKIPINFLKKYNLVPIRRRRDSVIVAISNATDLSPLDDARMLLKMDVKPVLARKNEIIDAINRIYDRATQAHDDLMEDLEEQSLDSMEMPEAQDLLDSEDEAPIIRLVNSLLFRAVKERASDIHVEPFEKELSVRFRIDGVLYEIMKPPKRAQASISSRIKIMAQLDIAEKRIPQDGRIKIKIAGRDVDIRVSTLPTSFGERIVMRLLDTASVILNLEDLGFNERQLSSINQVIHKSHGIFLVTGPTGSGKSTTLYAALTNINSKERNIITVEDPVEIQLSGIGQIQVNPKVNLTFASGLRSILRQDPDVIMVGEIRDLETAEIAIQASLTGHLVFSTLHTNDAASSITRLVDMGVEPFLVSSSLVAVMAQRLLRVVCKECREAYNPTEAELGELGIKVSDARNSTIYRPRGCSSCWNTGYLGRTGIHEILPVDEKMRNLILKNADGTTLKRAALDAGMLTLREDSASKVLDGVTTIEEALRITQEDMEFD